MKQPICNLKRLVIAFYCIFLSFSAIGSERVALVIGNSRYEYVDNLKNPENDAREVAKRLEADEYVVTEVLDADVTTMLTQLKLFAARASEASMAVFFYAGHGLEVEGKNFLTSTDTELLIDTSLRGEELNTALQVALERETLPFDKVLVELGSIPGLKLMVLDCCRNNPFTSSRSWAKNRSGNSGLAAVEENQLPLGSMIVFSGAPGATVPDGAGTNSPFTKELLVQMNQGGLGTLNVFTSVSLNVNGGQEPWIKFDGSGRSLAEFSRMALIRGKEGDTGVTPGSASQQLQQDLKLMKEQLEYLTGLKEKNDLSPVMEQKLVELKEEAEVNVGAAGKDKRMIVSYKKSDGLNIRDSRFIGTNHNIHGALFQYRSDEFPLVQIGNSVKVGSTEWVKLRVTGWVRIGNSRQTFLTDQGNGRWKVIWNRSNDPLYMRQGTTMADKKVCKLAYATELTAIKKEGAFVLATFSGWSVKKSATKEYIRELF